MQVTRKTPALLLLATVGALVAGCSSTPLTEPTAGGVPVETRAPVATTGPGAGGAATTSPTAPQSQVATVDLGRTGAGAGGAGGAMAGPAERVVYFDFDSYAVRDGDKPVIEGHARALGTARNRRMVIEGHTDERGGREYNLALGQKRAEAVLKSLTLLGVADTQLEAVSFGEERPAATGSDETAWSKNRRAELKDR